MEEDWGWVESKACEVELMVEREVEEGRQRDKSQAGKGGEGFRVRRRKVWGRDESEAEEDLGKVER